MLTEAQKQEVLKFIQSCERPSFTFRDVVRYLDLDSDDRRSLQRYLDELDSEEIIHRVKRGRYSLSRSNLVAGILTCHRDGYGFLVPDDRSVSARDIFIPARKMEGALHGDRVLVRVSKKRPPRPRRRRKGPAPGTEEGERLEGQVVRVLERRSPTIVGRFYEHTRYPFVVPLESRMLHDIQVPFHSAKGAKNGQVVVVAMTAPPGRFQSPQGRVVDILGYPGDRDIEYKIVQHKFGLPVDFTSETIGEIDGMPERVAARDLGGREDFREELTVTIDQETAHDFDDAVSLGRLPNGNFSLGVHIADVSHYVIEGSALDTDAYARGTSVYFPDRAIPMLPPKLSTGICSLKPEEDRLVFSVIMEVDRRGKVLKRRFTEGVIRSRHRLTYTAVSEVLEDRDPALRKEYAGLVEFFETMRELCLILARKRHRRGAVDFDLPEAEMLFDKTGRVVSVVPSERTIAHRIIEEFMLLANETVAAKLAECGGPALYRVHEKPDGEKVNEFAEFALALGYRLESHDGEYRPRDFQKFVEQLEGKPEGRFLSYLMLRSFMQARYSEENVGHFGLAAEQYTHFTSPIRRYPDLVVHRLLKECLKPGPSRAWQDQMKERMPAIALHTSSRERNAAEAEREIENIKKVQFMADKVGDTFEAVILSVIRQGFFVELLEHFVEGFVPVATLTDDYYVYHEKNHALAGERGKRQFRLGTRVLVRLDHADQETYRLTFSFIRILI